MGTTTLAPSFDYVANAISPDDEELLEQCAARVEESREAAVNNFMVVAGSIAVAHDVFANRGNGCFGAWVAERCRMSRTYAHSLLCVHRRFGECQLDFTNFDAGSLMLLANDEVGSDLRQQILEAGNSGTRITQSTVKGILAVQEKADDADTAEAATADLLERAANGERISKKTLRQVAEAHGITTEEETERETRLSHHEAIVKTRKTIDRCVRACPAAGRAELIAMLKEIAARLEKGVSDGNG